MSHIDNITEQQPGILQGSGKEFTATNPLRTFTTMEEARSAVDKAILLLPENVKEYLREDNLYGRCGNASGELQSALEKLGFDSLFCLSGEFKSDGNLTSNGHTYLVSTYGNHTEGQENEVLIDITAGQFLLDKDGKPHKPFVGTRSSLKQLVTSGEVTIVNTKSRNNPEEAFLRIWGDTSIPDSQGNNRSPQKRQQFPRYFQRLEEFTSIRVK